MHALRANPRWRASSPWGVVGKHFCHQTMTGVNVHFKDRWLNPFLASGPSQTCIDEFNEDNFDHSGLGFFGGGYIYSNVRQADRSAIAAGTPAWGSKWGVIFTSFLVIGFALFLFEIA
jgi:hypothetical protein